MRGKIRFSRWLMAIVLTVAEYIGVAPLAIVSRADPQAQTAGDFFGFDLPRGRISTNIFKIYSRQRIGGGCTDANQMTTRSHRSVRPDQNLRRTRPRLRKSLPRKVWGLRLPPSKTCRCRARARRPGWSRTPLLKRPVPTSILSMSLAHRVIAISDSPRSPLSSCCQGSSARVIAAVAIWLDWMLWCFPTTGVSRSVKPTAVLRCAMADSFAAWVRDEASVHIAPLGAALRGVETYGSYDCRGRNSVIDAKLSEHGKGNAIDVRALVLTGDRHTELTGENVAKPVREALRDFACHRFTTVLGPGADSYHNNHIHLDILERTHGLRICQWDVREPPPPAIKIASGRVKLAATSGLAQPQSRDNQTVTVGPWAIATNFKATKFESCTMSRSERELGITFVRAQDGATPSPQLAEVEARSRQGLFGSSPCRFAICGC